MGPVRSIKNQYRGVNAHLHSYWQNATGWNSFHGNHIADLLRALRAQLLPLGYTAEMEPSLQIRRTLSSKAFKNCSQRHCLCRN